MARFYSILLVVVASLVVSCSKSKTTAEIADEMSIEVLSLPTILKEVEAGKSVDSAAKQLQSVADSIIVLAQQVEPGEYLTQEQRAAFEKKLRESQDETMYLLIGLSARPGDQVQLVEPIGNLGDALEFASQVMKEP